MSSAIDTIGFYLDQRRTAYRCVDCLVEELPQLKLDEVQKAFDELSAEVHPGIHNVASAECGQCLATKPVLFVV
jgi:hypothetical protein